MGICLNLHILKDELAASHPVSSWIHLNSWILSLSYPRLFLPKSGFLSKSAVYVVTAEILAGQNAAYWQEYSFICIGRPPKSFFSDRYNFLYVTDESAKPEELLNDLLDIFHCYQHWLDKMNDVLENEKPLDRIGQLSLNFLDNPILMHRKLIS